MVISIFCVLHGEKSYINCDDQRIVADPPMNEQGVIEVQDVIEQLRPLLRFDFVLSSRLARGNDTASAVCIPLHLDWKTEKLLGQHGNLQDGKSVLYHGYEHEIYPEWLENTRRFLTELGRTYECLWDSVQDEGEETVTPRGKTLVFTHRPIVVCLLALVATHMGNVIPDKIKDKGDRSRQRDLPNPNLPIRVQPWLKRTYPHWVTNQMSIPIQDYLDRDFFIFLTLPVNESTSSISLFLTQCNNPRKPTRHGIPSSREIMAA